ncbi:MAG: N,N-dimethylformamidase beta subunit family domain-containing protein [Bacteroidota bacterium]
MNRIEANATITGRISNASLAAPIANAVVTVLDEEQRLLTKSVTEEDGTFRFERLESGHEVRIEADGHISKHFQISDIPDHIRLLEDELIGYQDKLWFEPGETIQVRVHAPHPFMATLYRHGQTKEPAGYQQSHSAYRQTVPDDHFVESGLNWETVFEYPLPEDAVPGIYSLFLDDEHIQHAIPMVVSTPQSQWGTNRLLVLASTNNWQTYNIWGGRSRYRNFENGASIDFMSQPSIIDEWTAEIAKRVPAAWIEQIKKMTGQPDQAPEWNFQPLSIKRPFTNCDLEADTPFRPFTNHLAAGEWRVLAWLEREGIPYDIITGYELHRHPSVLDHYEGILLNTHCEYWSESMYRSLKRRHRQHDLWIFNVSGNTMYRSVDFTSDGSIYCTSLKFEDQIADETKLIGARFTEGDYGTCAPYKAVQPEHWIFEDAPLSKNDPTFGHQSLNQNTRFTSTRYNPGRPGVELGLRGHGASGWETDKKSKTASKDFKVVAKGQNSFGGADMMIRESQGHRGGVFTASSITFGGALLIDDTCSQILRNVLDKAGIIE